MERRSVDFHDLGKAHAYDLRVSRADGQPTRIGGYAALYNAESIDLGGFVERIAAGAFDGSLAADVRALWNHDPSHVLGRTQAGTLRLASDPRGLAFEVDLPDTTLGRDVAVSIERRDVSGMSFGFRAIKDQWAKLGPGKWLRTLLDAELYDVSPVTFPAYPQTEVAVRSLNDAGDALSGYRAAVAVEESRLRRLRLLELGRT
jgi:uncharacterized protein